MASADYKVELLGSAPGAAAVVDVNNFPATTEISNDLGNPVPVSLLGLPGLTFDQMAVTTTESQLPNLAGRSCVSIKAMAANGAEVYIRQATGVTTLNSWELSAGDSFEVDADDTNDFFLVSSSGSQRCCWAQL